MFLPKKLWLTQNKDLIIRNERNIHSSNQRLVVTEDSWKKDEELEILVDSYRKRNVQEVEFQAHPVICLPFDASVDYKFVWHCESGYFSN